MYKFELPLNERTRRLISIENIFIRLISQIKTIGATSEISCFESFFNLLTTASRADVKIEIAQELQKIILKKKQLNKTKKNVDKIQKLLEIKKSLEKLNVPQGNFFGNDKFMQEIKTSSVTPTGIVSSDLPQLQFWLQHLSLKDKQLYFMNKITPYMPVFESVKAYLNTLRESVALEAVNSNENGLLNYQLDPSFKHDIVQIQLPQKLNLYPNLTSNKYTVNLQFSSPIQNKKINKSFKFKIGVSKQ